MSTLNTRTFALVFGAIYALVGLIGFIPGLATPPPPDAPGLTADTGYGYLFGLFPINTLHNLVHLVVGLAGIAAYTRMTYARLYAQVVAVVFGLLTLMGLVPGLDTTFGLIPLFGHDVWLHALTAAAAAYFGFARRPALADAGRSRV
ncbi:MAG TPA: DUF4383 domain-containing protein [Chloroflexota bacterium]|jgi:hypothetical protein|nr:DUF4383 domain-containing protein [Chloroflexota bacterium]